MRQEPGARNQEPETRKYPPTIVPTTASHTFPAPWKLKPAKMKENKIRVDSHVPGRDVAQQRYEYLNSVLNPGQIAGSLK